MNHAQSLASLLEAPRHDGPPGPGDVSAAAGSVSRSCAVQFSAHAEPSGLTGVRYLAFGGPELIGACEYVARRASGSGQVDVGSAADWLEALALPRDALATLLVVEDAWRGLVAALTRTD